jgi:hypothetical protein
MYQQRAALRNHGRPILSPRLSPTLPRYWAKGSGRFRLSHLLDGSCRREPDPQNEYRTISALCRARMFAPRLRVGDGVAYITKIGNYGEDVRPHWRLTALLRVDHLFTTHAHAADWYRAKGLPVPRNCIVPGNPPVPLDQNRRTPQQRGQGTGRRYEPRTDRPGLGSRLRRASQKAHGSAPLLNPLLHDEHSTAHLQRRLDPVARSRTPTQAPPRISQDLWRHLANRAFFPQPHAVISPHRNAVPIADRN